MTEAAQKVTNAFFDAQRRRPYELNAQLTRAATPTGGDWECRLRADGEGFEIIWRGITVTTVNPRGHLDSMTEGQIAMAIAAVPVLDAAMRSIIVLAEDAGNHTIIRDLAVACIALVEKNAPELEIGELSSHESEE